MNNTFTFVLAIVIVVMCAQLAKTYLKQRARRPEPNEELEQTLAKIDELEERIKVLERIVTEKRYDLKSEIDSL
jgi:membrane protein implicated in regulation of membrane protease activity